MNGFEIAVVGMAGRFPGARNIEEFWQNLRNRVESITRFSDSELAAQGVGSALLANPNYIKAWSVLADAELFDASFFGYSPSEARIMDPQRRLFLECAWEALEDAGYDAEQYHGSIGVYAGASMNTYLLNNVQSDGDLLRSEAGLQMIIGSDKDYLTTQVSYKLNLTGPSIAVQTSCSSSLVAVHLACQSLLGGDCDLALAGGVCVRVPQTAGYLYQEGHILSRDGHCRAFDAKSQGTVWGSGVGVVVLKRLEDALVEGDHVRAVIKGTAVNNDGALKVGYTAPSVDGQARMIARALAMADVNPESIGYVEAHGTGTALGDPVEVAALTQAFRAGTAKKGFCAIGSVKTNVGHLGAAAGIAGLIKTVLALENQELPPSLHFEQPNPRIDFANSPFYVQTTLSEWSRDKITRRAGVSSFGIGGTNAHAIIEEAPLRNASGESRPSKLLVLSAKTPTALERATTRLARHLRMKPGLNLADVAHTLQIGRKGFNHRRMLISRELEDAATALETLDPKRVFTRHENCADRPVIFMFPGQGAQHVNMGLELYRAEARFREDVDRCSELLRPQLKIDLRDVLYPTQESAGDAAHRMKQASIAPLALFVVEYALARLWISWGVRPEAMIGHSIGEYTAACLAGVFSLEEVLLLLVARGRLMQALPAGAMLAVSLCQPEIEPLLGNCLSLAAINGPSLSVVSGATEAVETLERELTKQAVPFRRLHTSHAFHSEMMAPILGPFTDQLRNVNFEPPKIPYLSNVTGTWITTAEATSPDYWARHLRLTVRFAEGLQELLKEPTRILLEVGPGRTLSAIARSYRNKTGGEGVLASLPHPRERESQYASLLSTLGQLWLAGVKIDWSGFSKTEGRYRVPLPTYPFESRRYWIESRKRTNDTDVGAGEPMLDDVAPSGEPRPVQQENDMATRDRLEFLIIAIWQEVLGVDRVGIDDDFFKLGGDSLLAGRVLTRLHASLGADLPVRILFEAPTVEELARRISQTHYANASPILGI